MGCSLSAIADDGEEYERLCQKYGEKPELEFNPILGSKEISIYGNHSRFLKDFNRGDLGKNFKTAKRKFFSDINKQKQEIQAKIKKAKSKLTKEEISLLGINN